MITKFPTKTVLMGIGFLAFAAFILGLPADALAQGLNLDTQAKRVAQQAMIAPKLLSVGAYVIGVFFAIRALFALKGFIESPDDNPITKVLGFGAIAALLIMLPYVINILTNSMTVGSATQVTHQADKFDNQTTW